MSDWPAVDLVYNLLKEHQVERLVPHTIACVHADLAPDVPLLSAALARYGGRVYDLSAPEEAWTDPQGPIVPERLELIAQIWLASTEQAELVIEEEAGSVIGRSAAAPGGYSEPSLRILLRAAALLASSALDAVDMITVCAESVELDPTRRELLWRLLTVTPEDLKLRSGKTLVAMVGADLDPDVDYGRIPPVRLVARGDRVLRRSVEFIEDSARSIARAPGPLVLFLGAGASASARVPLGNVYRDRAIRDLLGLADDFAGDLSEQFFGYLVERDRFRPGEARDRSAVAGLTLERVLRETFHKLGVRARTDNPVISDIVADCENALDFIRPGRRAIRALASALPGRLVLVTVNFDQLLETDIGVPVEVLHRPEHFGGYGERLKKYLSGDGSEPLPVLKLHGSIQDPSSLIASIDNTSAGLHDDVKTVLNVLVRGSGETPTWVWVGCSMRDRDVNSWLRGLGTREIDEWWVDPMPSASLDDFFLEQRQDAWSSVGIGLDDRLLIESSDRFLSTLQLKVAEWRRLSG